MLPAMVNIEIFENPDPFFECTGEFFSSGSREGVILK